MKKAFDMIQKYHMIENGDHLIVGVSGGADSLCLLFLLLEWQKNVDFQITVVHVEHGIRGEESLEDARFVKELCSQFHIPFRMESFDIKKMASEMHLSVEEAGRTARYQAFERALTDLGANKIAVAHNQNDQAETMLWNMARGSGMNGAAGIRPVRGTIIRPLLRCSRAEIEDWLKQREINWREDRTNQEMDYTRNILRGKILPAFSDSVNSKTVEHLAMLGEELQGIENYLGKLTEQKLEAIAEFSTDPCGTEKEQKLSSGRVSLDIKELCKEEEIIVERIIRMALQRAGCPMRDFTRQHVSQIKSLLEGQSGKMTILPGNWICRREFHKLYMEKKPDAYDRTNELGLAERVSTLVFANNHQIIPRKKYTKWLNYDKIKCDVQVRTRRPGDYLIIDQMGHKKKLKAYFVEEKIPAEMRERIPLVAVGSEILWVIGYRISEAYKVDENTREIIEIQYEEEE